jgi:hypothetical protein
MARFCLEKTLENQAMDHSTTELFCLVDDFCQLVDKEMVNYLLPKNTKSPKSNRTPNLHDSEIMSILILFQTSGMKNFKAFYIKFILGFYKDEFPKAPFYARFVSLIKRVSFKMMLLLKCLLSKASDISFVDSTPIKVCHNKRIFTHKVFAGLANRGKSSMGWFFGFKLHAAIDKQGNLIGVELTEGSRDDREPVERLLKGIIGKAFADKGYIDKKLFARLYTKGVKLVTGIKKNMQNKLMILEEKKLLRKRSIIETVFGYLKETLMLVHTRHRSPANMMVHVMATLISYQLLDTKPSISPLFAQELVEDQAI